jgi:transcriptional regulator with XRE-family HTH domain
LEGIGLAIGMALRRARRARGLTLRDISTLSGGRYKPTSIAGYERAERTISLERFCDLCQLYGVAPPTVLAQILEEVEGGEPEIDLAFLESIGSAEAALISGFVREIRALRHSASGESIVLRAGDVEVLATAAGKRPEELTSILSPAGEAPPEETRAEDDPERRAP